MELNYHVGDTLQPYVERDPEDLPLLLKDRRLSVWSKPCQDILEKTGLSKFLPSVVAISGHRIFYSDPQDVFLGHGARGSSRSRPATEGTGTVSAGQVRSLEQAWTNLEAEQDKLARELKESLLVPSPRTCGTAWQARNKNLAVLWGLRPRGAQMVTLREALNTLRELNVVARSWTPWVIGGLIALAGVALAVMIQLPTSGTSLSPVAQFVLHPSEYCFVGQEVSANVTGSGLRDGKGQMVASEAAADSVKAYFYIDWGDGEGFGKVDPPVCRHAYTTSGAQVVRLKVVGPDDSNAVETRTLTVVKVEPVAQMQVVPGLDLDAGAPVTVKTDGSGYKVSVNGTPELLSLLQFHQRWADLAKGAALFIDWGDDEQGPRPMEGPAEEHRYAAANSYDVQLAVQVRTPGLVQAVETRRMRVRSGYVGLPRVDPVAKLIVASNELKVGEPANVSIAGSGYRLYQSGSFGPLMDLSDLQKMSIPGRDNARISVDWGDSGGRESVKTNQQPLQHAYGRKGEYVIQLAVRGPGGQESVKSDKVDVGDTVNVMSVERGDPAKGEPNGFIVVAKGMADDSQSDEPAQGWPSERRESDPFRSASTNSASSGNQGVGSPSGTLADDSPSKSQGSGGLNTTLGDSSQSENQMRGSLRSTPPGGSPPQGQADDGSPTRMRPETSPSGNQGDAKRIPVPSEDAPADQIPSDWSTSKDQIVRAKSKYTYDKERGELRIDYLLPKDIPVGEVSGWKFYLGDSRSDLEQTPAEEVKQIGKGSLVFRWSNADGKPGLLEKIQNRGNSPLGVDAKAIWTSPSGKKVWILSHQLVTPKSVVQTDFVPDVKDVSK